MTRVEAKKEEVKELQSEIDKLKKGLKRKQSKKLLSCSNCLIGLIFVVIIIVLLSAYVLAKSGLKEVPFFTERFYQEPEPTYLVDSSKITESDKDLLQTFTDIVKAESLKQQKLGDFNVNLKISDDQLTAIVRDKVKAQESLNEKIDYIQVAVLPENLELFSKNKEPSKVIVVLKLKPVVKNGEIDLKVISFKVGDLKLPRFIGNFFFAYLTERSVNKVLGLYEKYGQVESLELNRGLIDIEILINDFKALLP